LTQFTIKRDEREKQGKKERKKKTSKTLQNFNNDTTSIIEKNIDKMNPTKLRKVMNGDRSRSHESSKYVRAYLLLNNTYDTL